MDYLNLQQRKSASQESYGFTLIELLTTIAIMVLILSLTIANIHGTNASRNVQLAQSDLISDLHKIQTYAVNSEDSIAGSVPASAWGIDTASATSYTIESYDDTINQNAQVISTTNFPAGVTFSSIQIQRPNGGGTVCPTSFTVQFTVPYGRVLTTYSGVSCSNGNSISGSQEPNDIITATIAATGTSVSQTVIINGISGNIVTP